MADRLSRLGSAIALCALVSVGACAPRLRPATGTVVNWGVPATSLPRGHQLTVFTWTLEDRDMYTRGEGAVRSASPDSARLDFFLSGGLASGAAILIGDDLRVVPGAERVKAMFLPSVPMLWAVAGRAAPPALPDTARRVDGDTLRVDIGKPLSWRLTYARDTLRRVERVSGRKIVEWVARFADGRVRYRNEVTRRQLDIVVTRVERTRLDAAIWTLQ